MTESFPEAKPTVDSFRPFYKWYLLGIASFAAFMGTLDGSIVVISYPELTVALDTDTSSVLWVTAASLMSSAALLLTVGRLSDAMGRKRWFTGGFLLFTLGLGISSAAQTILQLILFRVLTKTKTVSKECVRSLKQHEF